MTLAFSTVGFILFWLLAVMLFLYVIGVGALILRVEWWRIKRVPRWLEKKLEPLMLLGPFLIPFGVITLCAILGG